MTSETNLSDSDIDILKEVGNIAVGKTLMALRRIIDKQIDVSFPNVDLVDSGKVEVYFQEVYLMVGLHFYISGDVEGMMLYLFKKEDANMLIDVLKNSPSGTTMVLNELEVNTIKEISNILAGAYLKAMAELSHLTLIQSLPHLVFDTGPYIFDFLKGSPHGASHKLFLLKSKLAIANQNYVMEGNLILSLPEDQLENLLENLRKRVW